MSYIEEILELEAKARGMTKEEYVARNEAYMKKYMERLRREAARLNCSQDTP